MKSFKKFVAEVAQPKPEEEKRFKDQHTYEVIKHPVATDAQFTGDIDKPKAKRIADQEGEANYDKAVKNPEKRMAAESVNEEAELELSEEIKFPNHNKALSYHSAQSIYHNKQSNGHAKAAKRSPANSDEEDHHDTHSYLHDEAKEAHQNALDKLDKHGHDHPTYQKAHMNARRKTTYIKFYKEEAEQIDEISKDMAQRYYNKSYDAQRKAMSTMIDTEKARKPEKKKAYDDAKKTFLKRGKGSDMAAKRLAYKGKNEEVEQIDEISKDLAGRYIKKAQVDSADAGMDTASQDRDIRQRGIKKFLKRRKGVDSAVKRLMQRDESTANDRARYDAADDKDKKKVTLPKAPWDKKDEELSPKQKKIDANKNGKIDGHDLAMLRKKKNEEVEVTETTSSALKRPVTQTGPDGKTRTVMKKTKMDKTDDRGQDQITTRESVEMIDEAMKMKRGPMRLKDGSQIMVSKEDADLLNRMFSDLSPNNQRQMQKVMMMDKAGFEEIRGFAKEAL